MFKKKNPCNIWRHACVLHITQKSPLKTPKLINLSSFITESINAHGVESLVKFALWCQCFERSRASFLLGITRRNQTEPSTTMQESQHCHFPSSRDSIRTQMTTKLKKALNSVFYSLVWFGIQNYKKKYGFYINTSEYYNLLFYLLLW